MSPATTRADRARNAHKGYRKPEPWIRSFTPGDYVPQPGDIGLTSIKGRVGAGIRVAQWLNGDGWHRFQHALVYLGDGACVEAMPGGARIGEISRYDWCGVAWLRCPAENRDAVAAAARRYLGVPYSFADYLALAAHRFAIPTPHLKACIESSGHMICSQLADRAAEDGGWHLFDDGRWHGYVTPGDLAGLGRAQEEALSSGGPR